MPKTENVKYFICILCFPLFVQASIEVAFVEVRNYYGEIVQLEPDGQFAHIAISYRGYWLHAHPLRGVELVSLSQLRKMGEVKLIAQVDEMKDITVDQVLSYLGKPYDSDFTWGDDRIYCSELVAKLLSIKPQSMNFKSDAWGVHFRSKSGQIGISPDDIFGIFQARGVKFGSSTIKCEMLWN